MRKKLISVLGLLSGIFLFTQCEDDAYPIYEGKPYNPNQKLELKSFAPDSGGVAEQVILKGENFGLDKEKLHVYFNKKKATVIDTKGDVAYVIAPRLPGDTCVITVAIGKDSLQYQDNFYYKTKVHVTTFCGNPHADPVHKDGPLSEALMSKPYYIAVDNEKNIFVGQYPYSVSGNLHRIRLLNEEKNMCTTIYQASGNAYLLSGCCCPVTQKIYFPLNGSAQYIELDPEKQWAPRKVTPILKNDGEFEIEDLYNKWSFAVSPEDQKIYTLTKKSQLISIDPKTHEAELVMDSVLYDQLGGTMMSYLTFDPIHPYMIYFVNPNPLNPWDEHIPGTDKVWTIDLRRKLVSEFAGSGIKGALDGPKHLAQFNNPSQICFDKDGTIYIGDTDNCCVRKIDKEGYVSTVVGIPGEAGYMDGDPETALFNRFWGMHIDPDGTLYIADYYNWCVRKLVIE